MSRGVVSCGFLGCFHSCIQNCNGHIYMVRMFQHWWDSHRGMWQVELFNTSTLHLRSCLPSLLCLSTGLLGLFSGVIYLACLLGSTGVQEYTQLGVAPAILLLLLHRSSTLPLCTCAVAHPVLFSGVVYYSVNCIDLRLRPTNQTHIIQCMLK